MIRDFKESQYSAVSMQTFFRGLDKDSKLCWKSGQDTLWLQFGKKRRICLTSAADVSSLHILVYGNKVIQQDLQVSKYVQQIENSADDLGGAFLLDLGQVLTDEGVPYMTITSKAYQKVKRAYDMSIPHRQPRRGIYACACSQGSGLYEYGYLWTDYSWCDIDVYSSMIDYLPGCCEIDNCNIRTIACETFWDSDNYLAVRDSAMKQWNFQNLEELLKVFLKEFNSFGIVWEFGKLMKNYADRCVDVDLWIQGETLHFTIYPDLMKQENVIILLRAAMQVKSMQKMRNILVKFAMLTGAGVHYEEGDM